MFSPHRVAIAGDWHGNSAFATLAIRFAALYSADVIVHLGDFTPMLDDEFLASVDADLDRYGVRELRFLRGRNDDAAALRALPRDLDGFGRVTDRIRYIPDRHRWEWDGAVWLALAGASSIDRAFHTDGEDWWACEQVNGETAGALDIDDATGHAAAHVVVSHDAPDGFALPGPGRAQARAAGIPVPDPAHRGHLGRIADAVQPHVWFHGQYHRRYEAQRGDMRVVGLAAERFGPSRNTVFASTAGQLLAGSVPDGHLVGPVPD